VKNSRLITIAGLLLGCGQNTAWRCTEVHGVRVHKALVRSQIGLWETRVTLNYPGAAESLVVYRTRLDSIPEPRPSDSLWDAEHCWQGVPRQ
jgi:hypothetical protein